MASLGRRARAAAFAGAAALCAGLAAAATGARPDGSSQYGELRNVVVAAEPLPARRPLRDDVVADELELRRVPERFVPPDALASPAQALGRSPAAPIPAGGYLLASQLESPGQRPRQPALAAGRVPVEITVAGAGALAGRSPARVDVVVTNEARPGGSGRTYVAAPAVELLDLQPVGGEPGVAGVVAGPAGDAWTATLAVTRGEALRLIQAESFARSIRLIGR